MKQNEYIENILKILPEQSGVYRYYNNEGTIIYVGKAKNLKKRVSSYFNKEQHHRKVQALVANIADIQYTVVDTETDALLLENNLIKQYQPKYNILLKDDKTSRCGVGVYKKEKLFVTQLRASKRLSEKFIEENLDKILDHHALIIEGYLLNNKFEMLQKLCHYFSINNKMIISIASVFSI